MELLAKIISKPVTWVILAGLSILGAVFYFGRQSGKKDYPKDQKLPNNGSGIPSVGYDSKGRPISWSPKPLASEAYDVLNGIFVSSSSKEALLIKLNALTDDQLTAVYNQFNHDYYNESDGTLTRWINSDYSVLIGSVKDALVKKMRELGLK